MSQHIRCAYEQAVYEKGYKNEKNLACLLLYKKPCQFYVLILRWKKNCPTNKDKKVCFNCSKNMEEKGQERICGFSCDYEAGIRYAFKNLGIQ